MRSSHDYSYVIYSPSLSYGDSPNLVHSNEIDGEGFSSLYSVTEETARSIKAAGTTARFRGVVWGERLWIDFDSYEAGRRAESKLKELGYDFVVYDSGGRGLHIGVLRDAAPSHVLPYQDKEWVRSTFVEADLSIYTHLHLFRLPGTVHGRTGRRKELLSKQAGKVLVLPPWRAPNESRTDNISYSGDASNSSTSIFESNRVMANTIPTRVGERHPTLLKLSYSLKLEGVPEPIARWWVGETNKMAQEPKSDGELDNIVRKVYESKETF